MVIKDILHLKQGRKNILLPQKSQSQTLLRMRPASWDIVVHLKEKKSFQALNTDGSRGRILM